MQKLYIDRFNSFKNSLNSLMDGINRDRKDTFIVSGVVQKFSLTFDLAWKLMKDILIQVYNVTDFAMGSPSEILKKSFANNLIDNDIWMNMLKDRNNLMHDYDEKIANESVNRILDVYIKYFSQFKEKVEKI